ncbi:MAG TPA: response regulator [Gemmataceae bacterium]|nr:response regulator [Gemmataceae bacterium]
MTDSQSVGETVLIIENDFTARELLAVLIRRHGFGPVTAKNGAVALALLAGWVNPDLIILDMLMPEVDGWRFLDAVRQSRHRDVPVIITSGVDLTAEWAADHGCAGFLHKPFDDTELFAAIGHILKSPDARRGSPMPAAGERK